MEQQRILVADDEPKILKILVNTLQREGYHVTAAEDGQEALEKFDQCHPDLVILDVMMPKLDGFEVCRQIRAMSNLPVIFLSAKGESVDRIVGLTLGSDDYITKPFDTAELLLRIKAILRRAGDRKEMADNSEIIQVAGLVIDRTSRNVEVEGQDIQLTSKEFDLLWLLASRPNQVFTRDQLIYQIWHTEYVDDTGVVTTLVKRLREKVEPDPGNPRYIKTIRGVGYKFGLKI